MSRFFRAYNKEKDEEYFFDNFSFCKKFFGGEYFKEGGFRDQGLPIEITIKHKQKSKKGGTWLISEVTKFNENKSIQYTKSQNQRGECEVCGVGINHNDHFCNKCYQAELGVEKLYQDSQNEFKAQIQSTKQAPGGW